MKKNIRFFITFIFVIALLSSCFKEVKFDDNDFKPMLVLNGIVEQDTNFVVNVSQTHSILTQVDTLNVFILDATVKLFENDKYLETLIFDSLGIYHSINKAKANTKYKITVEKEGFETATGYFDFTNPASFEVKNVEYELRDTIMYYDKPVSGSDNFTRVNLNYTIVINDNANEKNNYSLFVYSNVQEIGSGMIFNENGYEEYIEYIDNGYSKIWYNFIDEFDYQKYENYFKSFYTFNTSFDILTDDFFNGQKLELNYECYFTTTDLQPLKINLVNVSDELLKYLESEQLSNDVAGNPYTEPVNIYSNVENGVGITIGLSSSSFVINFNK